MYVRSVAQPFDRVLIYNSVTWPRKGILWYDINLTYGCSHHIHMTTKSKSRTLALRFSKIYQVQRCWIILCSLLRQYVRKMIQHWRYLSTLFILRKMCHQNHTLDKKLINSFLSVYLTIKAISKAFTIVFYERIKLDTRSRRPETRNLLPKIIFVNFDSPGLFWCR